MRKHTYSFGELRTLTRDLQQVGYHGRSKKEDREIRRKKTVSLGRASYVRDRIQEILETPGKMRGSFVFGSAAVGAMTAPFLAHYSCFQGLECPSVLAGALLPIYIVGGTGIWEIASRHERSRIGSKAYRSREIAKCHDEKTLESLTRYEAE